MAARSAACDAMRPLEFYSRIGRIMKLLDQAETLILMAQEDLEYLVDRDTEGYASCAWGDLEEALAKLREIRETLEAWLKNRD